MFKTAGSKRVAVALVVAATLLVGVLTVVYGRQGAATGGTPLARRLTPLQYQVTQEKGTEPAFQNEHWNNHQDGLYLDVVSGAPLFSSRDKFDSGTGWPSFTKPLVSTSVATARDSSHGMARQEVRSRQGDSHLGHVFDDGPSPGGQRYCINSASLRFVPVDKLEEEGLGSYLPLFGKKPTGTRRLATLAGGCFWGMQELLRKLPGVVTTKVGYTGGRLADPTYAEVSRGDSGHAESVEILFDPTKTSYETILATFFRIHDPTTANQQGNDRGSQYRSAIFYHGDDQRRVAEAVVKRANAAGRWKGHVTTEVVPASTFYRAEENHQDYLQKHPGGYTCHFFRD